METKDKRIKALIIIGCILSLAICAILFLPTIKYLNDYKALKEYFETFGLFEIFIYILLVLLQILVPFIPGEPFEVLAGYLFGSIMGSLIALLGESIASIVIILLVRKYGRKIVDIFFKDKDINKINFFNNQKLLYLFAILFIMPGTPKDLLCYVVGLSKFELCPLLLIVTLGRIPSIITSTIPAATLSQGNYNLAIIIYLITFIISLIGLFIYNKIVNKKQH